MEKEPKIPELPHLEHPYKVESPPKEARASFYEFVKNKIEYLTSEEIIKWDRDRRGYPDPEHPSVALYDSCEEGDNLEKWVDNLEIAINKDAFKIKDKDYSDLMPFVVEHEIYEAWLRVKKGIASTFDREKQHILAQRRTFLLAEQQGLGDRLLEWSKLIIPDNTKHIKQCEYALKAAKKQLGHTKSRNKIMEKELKNRESLN